MADDHAYVPVLIARQGERIALRELRASVKARLEPMFVVSPVPWDWDNDQYAKTLAAHQAPVAKDLVNDWGTGTAFVDTVYLPDDLVTGQHAVEVLVADAAARGLPLVPVTGPERSADHHAAVARLAAGPSSTGVCLRVPLEWALNLSLPPAQQLWTVPALLGSLGVGAADVDLVLDFSDEVSTPMAAATVLRQLLSSLPSMSSWRTVTFVGTSIPSSMQGVPTQAVNLFPRGEWDAWLAVMTGSPAPARAPRFGDYAVQHPDMPTDVNPRFMRVFSQLRYSINSGWLIARGLELRKDGYAHVQPLMGLLAAQGQFAGAGFSAGDQWIDDCGSGVLPTNGSPQTWRKAGTNHHMVRVATDLAAQYGLPAPP